VGRKEGFSMRAVRPRDEVGAPSLQALRSGWGAVSTDGAVGVPAQCRGWGRRPEWVPSNSTILGYLSHTLIRELK